MPFGRLFVIIKWRTAAVYFKMKCSSRCFSFVVSQVCSSDRLLFFFHPEKHKSTKKGGNFTRGLRQDWQNPITKEFLLTNGWVLPTLSSTAHLEMDASIGEPRKYFFGYVGAQQAFCVTGFFPIASQKTAAPTC